MANRAEEDINQAAVGASLISQIRVGRQVNMGMAVGVGKNLKLKGAQINAIVTFLHSGGAETVTVTWYLAQAHTVLPGHEQDPSMWSRITEKSVALTTDLSSKLYTVTLSGVMPGPIPPATYDQFDALVQVRGLDGYEKLPGLWVDDQYSLVSAVFDSLSATFS